MFELKWVYEFILIIYGLSLVSYFLDFIQDNRRANRIAFWLLSMVWVIQTLFLLLEVVIERNFPVITLNDGLFFYAWVLVTISLIINKLFTIHFIAFFTNLFGFFILLFHISTVAQNDMKANGVQLVHEILVSHITLAIVSYGFFTVSFLISVMYLVQYKLLKKKKGFKWMWRFGDLNRLDTFSFWAITIGVPLLLIGIILGVVWAYSSRAEFYWFDLKTIGSILVLAVYILYLILRLVGGYKGKTIAIYNTAAFLVLLINFFLFSLLSNFHFSF
ncbi:cytochrome c biogenesis protein [Virgibacillus halodenitrificans]|jgi:HemX protein|uniref:Cytochrome C assembly protein n=1 Tax=Virgibacillus halodenitrificans TaxID=1482 RepID=A0AAC9NKQ1_VIRHA|nr:cytochrome c biogenesis protein CcsA [Virgibacillus halodenitrificans]APC48115.1 cytochrome C assembly protein [Virgibacillus halodenitrificans]MBD1223750.1 cytochrome c biogenesis protein CcsA [Virgibacillus halodenitrificans]MCG1027889.1 cytochrome c biogenesis protein CcsA [Virgibacillus halodenitrificans]MEC2159944.1 cytochrome c biogenesis protein CcsA [Virgibacillus halodenitrificans]MYL44889.1 cytochrome C assembly protein [Virgibacillus halodenitrificans]